MSKKPSIATMLVGLVRDSGLVEFFSAPDGTAYVYLDCGDHRETLPVRGTAFRRWLRRIYYLQEGLTPGAQSLEDAIGTLEGFAHFEAPCQDVHLRVAEHHGAVFLDLADDYWRAVRIDPGGWEVIQDPPVRFRRPPSMRALPVPERGGSLDELRPFVNVAGEDDWILLVSGLVGAFHPRGPYVVLALHGEAGSAKSTTGRSLRRPEQRLHCSKTEPYSLRRSAARA